MLTDAQMAALRLYAGTGHRAINAYLRGEDEGDPHLWAVTAVLDAAVAAARLDADTTLYRGIDPVVAARINSAIEVGVVIRDAGFLSTSLDPGTANIFAAIPPGGVILRIAALSGTVALDLSPYSDYPDEKEFLLPRDTELRVVRVEAGNAVRIARIDVEVL